jgi:adenosylmethionine-8-amino-7-oxononanoate aminotransferase
MKSVCQRHGALFILDEVMCGMGRCGSLHAWEQEDIVPDLQTLGKGLGGGYAPVSGVLISEHIVNALDKGSGAFRHGQTYQGHPISCAAALAVQRVTKEQRLLDNVRDMGSYLESRLRSELGDHPNVGDIRGKGLFWGVCCLAL